MKNINYKMKYLNRVNYSSKEILGDLQLSRKNSCVYKKNVKLDKNQINLLFCEKPVSKSVRS